MSLWRFIIGSTMGDQTGSATFICRDATIQVGIFVAKSLSEVTAANTPRSVWSATRR